MTYGGFQRFDESQAYSKMRREQIESKAQERKEILEECKEASTKIEKGVEELSIALQEYNDLQDKNSD